MHNYIRSYVHVIAIAIARFIANLYRNCGASKHSTITVTSLPSQKYSLPLSIRQFRYKDVQIKEECILGVGTFEKCTKARIARVPSFSEQGSNMNGLFLLKHFYC